MRVKNLLAVAAVLPLLAFSLPPQQQNIDLELSVQPGQLLDVDLNSVTGSIEITGSDGDTFAIEGTVSAREWRDDSEVTVDQSGDGIRIYSEYVERGRQSNRRRLRVDLTIRVPRSFDVRVNGAMDTTLRDIEGSITAWTGNADIEASGLRGEADLSVANGNLRISDSQIEGELSHTNGSLSFRNGSFHGELDGTNGSAEIDQVSGDIEVGYTNGTVRMGDVAGNLRGETTNGSVRAGTVDGEIRIETVNGSVSATLAGGNRVEIETLNGSVEIDAPADLSARFDLQVRQTDADRRRERPEIRSDFPLDMSPGEVRGGDYYRTATGTSGSGAQRIEVSATNGNVVIRRVQ